MQKNSAVNASIMGEYLFIKYGRLLKYCKITKEMLKLDRKKASKMTDLAVDFHSCAQIVGIYDTVNPDVF